MAITRRLFSLQPRLRCRDRLLSLLVFLFLLIFLAIGFSAQGSASRRPLDLVALRQSFPLTIQHIRPSRGAGGAWYIPSQWHNESHSEQPRTIVEAATLASREALADPNKQIDLSDIPLIIHQTWKSANISTWKLDTIRGVENWLQYTASQEARPMAYMFWDDDGIRSFMETFESDFDRDFSRLTKIQQTDAFRVLVCKHIGGIYADIDTTPLRHPSSWVSSTDIQPWHDDQGNRTYASAHSVSLIVGLEADTDPDTDRFWRMGYKYPVQLTQWAFASAPGHPVLSQFVKSLRRRIGVAVSQAQYAGLEFDAQALDPLLLTGPVAFTEATMSWLEEAAELRWNALTGLKDGGQSKLVDDVLVLPMTGFSPGRQAYMGSKPVTDPDARLAHEFQGSWRDWKLRVEIGKLCRTAFGLCRDWPNV